MLCIMSGNTDKKRGLVAIRELDAVEAVGPYFMRQLFFIHVRKTELSEKPGLVGQHKHPFHFKLGGLRQALLDQRGADSAPGPVLPHRERAYLGKAVPAHMQSAHARKRSVFLVYIKIAQVFVEFIERTRQHLPCFRVLIDERLDGPHIGELCLANHEGKLLCYTDKVKRKMTKLNADRGVPVRDEPLGR